MKISTLNKRRKKLNECKELLMKYIRNAIKLVESNDPLLTITPGFKMYLKYLQHIYKTKRYKEFYYFIHREDL